MRKILNLFLILAIFLTNVTIVSANELNELQIVTLTGEYLNDEALEQFKLTNKYRKSEGVTPFILDSELSEYARKRAAEIVIYFSHYRPDGSYVLDVEKEGLIHGNYGENVAYGFNSAESVMKAWQESSGHNTNMLRKEYISMGIGCFEYNGVKYWVQIFSDVIHKEIKELPSNRTKTVKVNNLQDYTVQEHNDIYMTAGRVHKTKLEAKVNHNWAFYELPLDGVAFSSSNKSVAKVDSRGYIYALKSGTTEITAKTKKGTIKFNVNVSSKYKIQYKTNGGTLHKYTPYEYSSAITLKEPTKKGYLFKGWYTGEGYKKKVKKLYQGDADLYARWTRVTSPKTTATARVTKSSKKVVITSKIKDVDGYQVYYSDNSFMKNVQKILSTSNKVYTKTFKRGQTCYYKVRTYKLDSTGNKVYSAFSEVRKVYID